MYLSLTRSEGKCMCEEAAERNATSWNIQKVTLAELCMNYIPGWVGTLRIKCTPIYITNTAVVLFYTPTIFPLLIFNLNTKRMWFDLGSLWVFRKSIGEEENGGYKHEGGWKIEGHRWFALLKAALQDCVLLLWVTLERICDLHLTSIGNWWFYGHLD